MRNLPQAFRFPGMAETRRLFPLSVRLSLEQPPDAYFDPSDASRNRTQVDDGLSAAYHSAVSGRQMEADDPEIAAAEAEQRGLGDKSELQGNLFSRSAWRRFTLLTLDKRGFLNEDERARVEDQGLCLRQRCANFDSVAGGDMREFLDEDKPLALRTFETQAAQRDACAAGGHATRHAARSARAIRGGLRSPRTRPGRASLQRPALQNNSDGVWRLVIGGWGGWHAAAAAAAAVWITSSLLWWRSLRPRERGLRRGHVVATATDVDYFPWCCKTRALRCPRGWRAATT